MQKALIIDDERLARNELKKLLLEFPEIEVVGEAANAAEGLVTRTGAPAGRQGQPRAQRLAGC